MRKPRKKSSGSVQKLDGDRVVEALMPKRLSTRSAFKTNAATTFQRDFTRLKMFPWLK
jgi:hypothetical protein